MSPTPRSTSAAAASWSASHRSSPTMRGCSSRWRRRGSWTSEPTGRNGQVSSSVEVRAELGLDGEPAELAVLALGRPDEVGHRDRPVRRPRRGRRPRRTMLRMLPPESLNGRARNVEVDVVGHAAGRAGRLRCPEPAAGRSSSGIGKSTIASSRRRNASSRFARRFVVRIASAVEALHPLEQVGDLDVGVAVAGVLDLGALAEERVGLVEEQDAVDPVGLREDPVEVLLGLADVLVDDRREVDDVEVEPEVAGDDLGRHRLAGARSRRRTAP